jgi:hypothetical protein
MLYREASVMGIAFCSITFVQNNFRLESLQGTAQLALELRAERHVQLQEKHPGLQNWEQVYGGKN